MHPNPHIKGAPKLNLKKMWASLGQFRVRLKKYFKSTLRLDGD